ncbi:MAG: hypothetical protein Q4B69_00300 [Slackia sp.]|nr:hypothetical protein [Slackia sp.]
MENADEGMFAQMMASMARAAWQDGVSADGAMDSGANASGAIEFFERENAVDESVEGVRSRMTFTGCFAIDGFVIQHKDETPVEAGFGADFGEANGPSVAWVWFSCPVNDAVKEKFEEFFGGAFDETLRRMDIPVEEFLSFSDSKAWGVFEQEDDEPLW